MSATLSPGQDDLTTALRSFLLAVLPAGTEVILAQPNRVPEPKGGNFVIMTPTLQKRLGTNLDRYLDCRMTGSISGSQMDVTAVAGGFPGKIDVGSVIFGVGLAVPTPRR